MSLGSKPVKIKVNGMEYEVPEGLTVAGLLGHLKMARERVAIERNLNILPRSEWSATIVQPDDSYEVVHFVGGG